ncbi:MAG: hypothetical protein GXP25_02720 [Planctomycetes bacterium]|nr:hypothetical protein [Planctomycetota bacterium]
MSSKDKSKRAVRICDQLRKKFRIQPFPEDISSVEALLIAILMEKTSLPQAEQTVKRFQSTFVDWNEMRVTSGREIAVWAKDKQIGQPIGRACRDALDKLYADRGEFDLGFLADESFASSRDYLVNTLRLPPRPAARLMLLFFNRPALPLSNEVRRVADRLGLVDPSWTHDRAQKSLERLIPSAQMAEFYHYTTQHAEKTCLAANPKCSRCLLQKNCDYYREKSRKKSAKKKSTTSKKTKKTKKIKKTKKKTATKKKKKQ